MLPPHYCPPPVIHSWLSRVPASVREFLVRCHSSLHRALLVATLFGDQSELRFWTVAAHYLPTASAGEWFISSPAPVPVSDALPLLHRCR